MSGSQVRRGFENPAAKTMCNDAASVNLDTHRNMCVMTQDEIRPCGSKPAGLITMAQ
jgi:hypothetical protein